LLKPLAANFQPPAYISSVTHRNKLKIMHSKVRTTSSDPSDEDDMELPDEMNYEPT